MVDLILGNEIFVERTRHVGVLPAGKAIEFGVSGPNLRGSGVRFDLRKVDDYLPYDRFDFEIPTGERGDCLDRYVVRLEEIRQAARIVLQAVEGIPSGPLQAKVPRVLKVPPGTAYVRAENPKGEMGFFVVSEGSRIPYRVKVRSASFSNISVLPWLLEGALVPDLIAILGSLDFVLGDVDR
jgi:NADH-quinone oxidoreductase subunit D